MFPDCYVLAVIEMLYAFLDRGPAAMLAAGEDLKSAARTLGITYGTARARLAEIFQKTETRRQGELINLLLTAGAFV